MEASAVETDHDPGIWKESVILLEILDVFIARFGHGDNVCVYNSICASIATGQSTEDLRKVHDARNEVKGYVESNQRLLPVSVTIMSHLLV
jgi:hypothetical protein